MKPNSGQQKGVFQSAGFQIRQFVIYLLSSILKRVTFVPTLSSHVLSVWSRHRECWWIQIQLDVLNWFKFNMNLISSQFSLSQVKLRESQFYISYLFIRGAKCLNFTFQDSLSLSSQQCKPLASDVIIFIESLVFKKHTHTHTHTHTQKYAAPWENASPLKSHFTW